MNFKRLSIFMVVIVVVAISIGAVSAFELSFNSDSDGNDITYNNGDLEIQGLEFKIPDVYEQDNNATKMGESTKLNGYDVKLTQAKFVKGDDEIYVKVVTPVDVEFTNPTPTTDNSVNKTIASKEGLMDYFEDDTILFYYVDDGKLVEIDAPDETTLESMLK